MRKIRNRIAIPDFFGRSEAIRTPGLLDPNQARYQLRYTPMDPNIIMIFFPIVKC